MIFDFFLKRREPDLYCGYEKCPSRNIPITDFTVGICAAKRQVYHSGTCTTLASDGSFLTYARIPRREAATLLRRLDEL